MATWRHTLDYVIIENQPILGASAKSTDGNLRVLYGDEELAAPHIVRIAFVNTGNRPIKGEDYEREGIGVFTYSDKAPVSMKVYAQEPMAIIRDEDVQVYSGSGTIIARPNLMNPRDRFELQIISDGNSQPVPYARFLGQSRGMQVVEERRRWRRPWVEFLFGVLLLALPLRVSFNTAMYAYQRSDWFDVAVGCSFFLVTFSAVVILYRRYWRS